MATKKITVLDTKTPEGTDIVPVAASGSDTVKTSKLSSIASLFLSTLSHTSLVTTAKTIIGAINEIYNQLTDLELKAGDTFTISNVSIGAGYTSSTTVVYMTFPINKPIASSVKSVSVSNLKCRVLQNGKYLFGATSSAMVTPSAVSAAITKGVGVRLVITFSSSTNATALMACGVQIEGGLKFTFS